MTINAADRRTAEPTGHDSFGGLVRAEFTKLRSVRRWLIGLFVALGLSLLVSFIGSSGSGAEHGPDARIDPVGPHGEQVRDELYLVHQPLSGDGSITAQVTSQEDSNEWAAAGVIVKESTEPGSQYAAMMVTPGHGVRFHANYRTNRAGPEGTAPRWLRLTRTGDRITGYESTDGATWNEVGSIELDGLPDTVEAGMFVTSPEQFEIDRTFGSTSVGGGSTFGTATFDNVQTEPAPPAGAWEGYDSSDGDQPGRFTEAGGVFTVSGSGHLAPAPAPDVVQISLTGLQIGQIALVAVAVLFITSEYRRGMIRTTLAVSPRRGRVLAAKAIVIGAVAFLIGLVIALVTYFLVVPVLYGNGMGQPWFLEPSLTDWPVQRALVGAGIYLALVALLSLGLATALRRSAAAITALILLLIVPFIVQGGLPLTAAQWLMRGTPGSAGSAITRTVEPDPFNPSAAVDVETMVAPLPGVAVLAAYAAAAMALGYWRLRRRDA
jgi:ABC-type transport system involved in multi-copper enzyme maturation permease subunit